jgi:dihydrofolate synthase / folylpolyglutamate synthase
LTNHPMWDEAERSLLGLFDFERQRLARRMLKPFTLERVNLALQKLGSPSLKIPCLHIAGTKGKGSTALYLHHLLQSAGKKTGLFTSPHLVSLTERIRVGEQCISIAKMDELAKELHQLNQSEFDGDLTFFEFLFLMAMLVFEAEKVDYIVLETGLGGRLDATNVVKPICSILTKIDYDHCDMLGNDLVSIAKEKAGIIKPNTPVLALRQRAEVNEVFEKKALELEAPLQWIDGQKRVGEQNMQMALEAFAITGNKGHREQLQSLHLPGRCHRVQQQGQNYFLDTAHNQISMENLASQLENTQEKIDLLFAMGESRTPKELLTPLLNKVEQITFVNLPGDRPRIEPSECLRVWKALGGKNGMVHLETDAIETWLKTPKSALKCITGSFYLVGEAYRILGFQPDQMLPNRLG